MSVTGNPLPETNVSNVPVYPAPRGVRCTA